MIREGLLHPFETISPCVQDIINKVWGGVSLTLLLPFRANFALEDNGSSGGVTGGLYCATNAIVGTESGSIDKICRL